ncbi:MAG: MaoC family dehydratase N-terminal domain-containing protein [Firmicutes bacterium]|jgi:acyl dehydratase|nr:MaoC family dehydratase N-terminal domain-containing protein [Bacillota bacterium]
MTLLVPVVHRVTRSDLVRYAGASEDFNPIHFDDDAARYYGLDGVIAHGMFTMGLVTRFIEPLLNQGYRVSEWSNRFRAMVPVNRTITIDGTAQEFTQKRVILNITVTLEDLPKPVLTGAITMVRGLPLEDLATTN